MKNPFRFDATDRFAFSIIHFSSSHSLFIRPHASRRPTTVSTLTQQYLFIPPTVKSCYLIYLVRSLGDKSMIIFAGKCRYARNRFAYSLSLSLSFDCRTHFDLPHSLIYFHSAPRRAFR